MRIVLFLSSVLLASAHPHDTNMSYPDSEGRSFLNLNINPPRRFTNKALSKAPACTDPSGFTGYCVSSAACRAFNGTTGARCPKRPVGTGHCCLVDRCPVAPPTAPVGGVVATSPIPASGSPMGTQVQYICMPDLVFAGLLEPMVTSTCDARGNWSPNAIPNCVTAPPTGCADPPPAAPTGILISDGGNRTIGALVFYMCGEGTFPDGQALTASRCSEDGTWSPAAIPSCVLAPPTACVDPPPTAPAGVTQHFDGDLTIGVFSVYICGIAGELFPSGATFLVTTCTEDGTWQPNTVPACLL